MVRLKIKFRDKDGAMKKIKRAAKLTSHDFSAADRRIAEKVVKRAKANAPGNGDLKSSIRAEGSTVVGGAPRAPYLVYQEFGFAAHDIPIEWIKQKNKRGKHIDNPKGFVRVKKAKNGRGYFLTPAFRTVTKMRSAIKEHGKRFRRKTGFGR